MVSYRASAFMGAVMLLIGFSWGAVMFGANC